MNKLIDWLRRFKLSYTLYNFFNSGKLLHNKKGYLKYNIKRPLYLPVTSSMFDHINVDTDDMPWMDTVPSVEVLQQHSEYQKLHNEYKDMAAQWLTNGYLILPGFLNEERVDSINLTIENLLQSGKISFRYGNKIMFANKISPIIEGVTRDTKLLEILQMLLGMQVLPFQTINFITGSQQKAHSDSIHMTTFPPGYLIAAWIALEDIDIDNGPLFYYPGSHRFDYLMKGNYTHQDSPWLLGEQSYKNYEHAVEQLIETQQPEKKYFIAKKGDVLIWHANLLHGGAPIVKSGSTRKSMVIHYFGGEAIKYHEITGRPALIEDK